MLIAVPAFAYLALFGNTEFGIINLPLMVFSLINFMLMIGNLLPVKDLDGGKAWRVFPILWRQRAQRMSWERKRPKARHFRVVK